MFSKMQEELGEWVSGQTLVVVNLMFHLCAGVNGEGGDGRGCHGIDLLMSRLKLL